MRPLVRQGAAHQRRGTVASMPLAALALACGLAVAGCTADSSSSRPRPSRSAVSSSTAPAVTPVDHLDGATRAVVSGVGIDVPAGWHTDSPAGGAAEVLRLFPAGAADPVVVLTVGRKTGIDEVGVDGALDGLTRAWGGTAHELRRSGVTWPAALDPEAVTFTYEDLRGADSTWQAMAVAGHDEEKTTLALVLLVAPSGELETSAALEVAGTIRFDG
ncbi:hypothetical protein IC607_01905 [Cellulomonas sp. JH27-2]|uniref:hypothetical protein n=1 Tax=Cellulomonas sp. JH27-2 TaxID=2774139 RepID=UPI00177B06C4|nr:hypothetical protein [Cellulomonas sp. JH27-2]MBD8057722.1 hypothetical protein [Cellulomonas sp. JH27-2]